MTNTKWKGAGGGGSVGEFNHFRLKLEGGKRGEPWVGKFLYEG